MHLQREIETYIREFPKLEPHVGRFAFIHGDEVLGIYDTFEQGLEAAYSLYDQGDFMVNEIEPAYTLQSYRNTLVHGFAA